MGSSSMVKTSPCNKKKKNKTNVANIISICYNYPCIFLFILSHTFFCCNIFCDFVYRRFLKRRCNHRHQDHLLRRMWNAYHDATNHASSSLKHKTKSIQHKNNFVLKLCCKIKCLLFCENCMFSFWFSFFCKCFLPNHCRSVRIKHSARVGRTIHQRHIMPLKITCQLTFNTKQIKRNSLTHKKIVIT